MPKHRIKGQPTLERHSLEYMPDYYHRQSRDASLKISCWNALTFLVPPTVYVFVQLVQQVAG